MLCRLFILFPVMLALCLLPGLRPAMALPSADVCEWAAQQAAQESGVPVDIRGALVTTLISAAATFLPELRNSRLSEKKKKKSPKKLG